MKNPTEILKEARESKGYTQKEIADLLNIGLRMYQKIEAGEFPKYKTEQIIRIDTILNTNLYELIYEQNSKSKRNEARPLGEETGSYTRNGNEFVELSSGLYKLKTKLVMHKAQAGYLTGWGDDEYLDDLPEHEITVNRPVAGQYMSFEAQGDSMDDGTKESIENGSIVTVRKIERKYWSSKLHLKKFRDFVIVCNSCENGEGGILLKRIIEHNTQENYIVCHSLNPDKKNYPDFRINMIDIMQIFNIVQVTRKY